MEQDVQAPSKEVDILAQREEEIRKLLEVVVVKPPRQRKAHAHIPDKATSASEVDRRSRSPVNYSYS